MNLPGTSQVPEKIADHLGPFIPLSILTLLGTIAFVRMKRPTANAKCFLSVLFSLAPWLCITGEMTVVGAQSAMKSNEPGNWILLPGLLLWLASPVLAILGLLEFRTKPGKYLEGKGAAIATLGQTGFVGFAFALRLYLDRSNLDDKSLSRVMLAFQCGTFAIGVILILFLFFKWGLPAYRSWLREKISRLQK